MALTQVKTTGIADDAVTTDKLAGGTDGHVITYDASGNPTTVGPGTDGQVLTSTGAGSPPAFEAIPASGISDVVSDTSPQLGGDLDANSNSIKFGDSNGSSTNLAAFGASEDLRIYHNGSETYIQNAGSDLLLYAGGNSIKLQAENGEDGVKVIGDGAVELYHNNVKKLETMTNGVRVQGGILFGSDTADANVLDDYEEGTFDNQNVLNGWGYLGSGSDANAAPTMTYNGGHYVKIGSMVYVHMRIAIGNYNSAQGTLVFGTMPFYADRGGTESLLEQHLGCWMNACSSGGEDVYAHTYGSSKYYYGIGKRSSSGHSDFTGPNGGSGLDISINGWYRIE